MTEKRFKVNYSMKRILEYGEDATEYQVLDISGAMRRLNALHEENEQLKKDATTLICSNQEYRKENEQLKKIYYDILKLLKMELVKE